MAKPFKGLREKMPVNAQKKAKAKAANMLAELSALEEKPSIDLQPHDTTRTVPAHQPSSI